jgi:hypothetical protein
MSTPKEKISVPIELLSLVQNRIDTYPSVLETEYYSSESLSTLTKKGKLVWYKYGLWGKTLDKQEGLIEYSKNAIYIYFKKRDNESSYKYFVLSNSDSLDSIIFLFHNLQKLITI